jgi:hypothetical protein
VIWQRGGPIFAGALTLAAALAVVLAAASASGAGGGMPAAGTPTASPGASPQAATPAGAPPADPSVQPLPPGAPSAEDVLKLTEQGARTVDYEGSQNVLIRGQQGTETATLLVARGDGDRLMIEVQPAPGSPGWVLVQQGQQRSAMGLDGTSPTIGQAELAAGIEPDSDLAQLLSKYRVVLDGTVQMLQKRSWVLRIVRATDGRLVERWTVDAATGLILERECYDSRGQIERSTAFTTVQEPYTPPPAALTPAVRASPTPAGPQRWFGQSQLGGAARQAGLPTSLPDGYRLRAGTRFSAGRATVVQLIYSDGLEEVSLFQQPGALTKASVPAGASKVAFAHETGYLWQGFPRGAAWQAGTDTDTLVGASPTDELQDMANSLPQSPMHQSLRMRLTHLFNWVRDRVDLGVGRAPAISR